MAIMESLTLSAIVLVIALILLLIADAMIPRKVRNGNQRKTAKEDLKKIKEQINGK